MLFLETLMKEAGINAKQAGERGISAKSIKKVTELSLSKFKGWCARFEKWLYKWYGESALTEGMRLESDWIRGGIREYDISLLKVDTSNNGLDRRWRCEEYPGTMALGFDEHGEEDCIGSMCEAVHFTELGGQGEDDRTVATLFRHTSITGGWLGWNALKQEYKNT